MSFVSFSLGMIFIIGSGEESEKVTPARLVQCSSLVGTEPDPRLEICKTGLDSGLKK